jgi:hypothetical protein
MCVRLVYIDLCAFFVYRALSGEDMDTKTNTLSQLRKRCRRQARGRTWFYHGSFFLATVALPLHYTIYLAMNQGIPFIAKGGVPGAPFGVWDLLAISSVALHLLCALFLALAGKEDIVLQTLDYEDALDELNKCDSELMSCVARHEQLAIFVDRLKSILGNAQVFFCEQEKLESVSLKEALDLILAPIVPFIHEIFGYEKGASFNFAVYCYNENTKNLECVYRKRSGRLEQEKQEPSRSWAVGVGHVGKCFAYDVAFIDPDIVNDSLFGRAKPKKDDENYYRSAISVPLRKTVEVHLAEKRLRVNKEKFGVLLLTSSTPDQFSTIHLELMRVLKYILEELIVMYGQRENICSKKCL